MKLGTILVRITETEGKEREKLQREFAERMKGHPEEKLLMDCYVAACKGNKYISFGRNVLPPDSLKDEGFKLKAAACGFNYHFE